MSLLRARSRYRAKNLGVSHPVTGRPIYAVRCGDFIDKHVADDTGTAHESSGLPVYALDPCAPFPLGRHLGAGLQARHPSTTEPILAAACVPCQCVPIPGTPGFLIPYQDLRLVLTTRSCDPRWHGLTYILQNTSTFWSTFGLVEHPTCPGTYFRASLGIATINTGEFIECGLTFDGAFAPCATYAKAYTDCGEFTQPPTECDGVSIYDASNVTLIADPFFLQFRNVKVCSTCRPDCSAMEDYGASCFLDFTITVA